MGLEQRVAIITGASQGIGAALVKAYRESDYRVVATARSMKNNADPDIIAVAGDIGEAATADRVVGQALERFGRVDALINNAGIFVASPFTKYTTEQFAQVISTNLAGFFHITQRAVEVMKRQGRGHIVNVTTSLVEHANSKVPAVLAALTKGGLDAATRSLAIEYARTGIRVNAVSPGIIKTPMHSADTYATLAEMHPIGRMGEISDVVGAILYLEGAEFVTGETLHVDGGQSAGH